MAIDVRSLNGVISAAGTLTLTFRATSRQNWIVSQVSINAPLVGGGAMAAVYRDGAFITPLVPTGDAAAGDPPVPVRYGHVLTVGWTGAVVGAAAEASIIFDDGT
jgi:hypothetical protein